MVASCQKDAPIAVSKQLKPRDSLVSVSLINNSSTPYEARFQGTAKYTVYVRPNGRQSAVVKAGTYDIDVYPSDASGYASYTISWNGLTRINSPRANFNVLIAPASEQQLFIY